MQLGGRGRVQRRAQRGRHRRLCRFVPLLDAFRVDVQHSGGDLGRAALLGQAHSFGAEGRIIRAAFVGVWRVFRDEGKKPP